MFPYLPCLLLNVWRLLSKKPWLPCLWFCRHKNSKWRHISCPLPAGPYRHFSLAPGETIISMSSEYGSWVISGSSGYTETTLYTTNGSWCFHVVYDWKEVKAYSASTLMHSLSKRRIAEKYPEENMVTFYVACFWPYVKSYLCVNVLSKPLLEPVINTYSGKVISF